MSFIDLRFFRDRKPFWAEQQKKHNMLWDALSLIHNLIPSLPRPFFSIEGASLPNNKHRWVIQ